MRNHLVLVAAVLSGMGGWGLQPPAQKQPPAPQAAPKPNAAITPADRLSEAWWKQRHEQTLTKVKQGHVELLFIGDSITQGWEDAGKKVWESKYAPMHALNLGYGGDRTQHVLWRLDNGEVDGLSPKAAVLMIGTNNSNGTDNTAQEIADGIKAVVAKLRSKLPNTKVLVLGVFPRGEHPNAQRDKLTEVNQSIARLDDGKEVFYMDIGPAFMQPDGTILKETMPDFLHLSEGGYETWADSISKKLGELTGAPK